MTIHWILYLLSVSLLVSCAGALLERWVRPRFWKIRTIWLLTLISSLVLPAVGSVVPHRYAERGGGPNQTDSGNTKAQIASAPVRWISLEGVYAPQDGPTTWDRWAAAAWLSASMATFGWGAGTLAVMARRRRGWRSGSLAGSRVFWSDDFGPAVVGLVRPTVVIATWVQRLPESKQRLILSHEQSHVEARDPKALALGMAIVALAPWNPLLWWQLRRLRLAIEVDCDRRLLAAGAEPIDYASVLLDCSLQRMTLFAVNAAMAKPVSTLERRIAFMHAHQTKGWTIPAAFTLFLAAVSGFAATQVPPPPGANASVAHLQDYAGNYGFAPVTILHIAVQGEHLVAAFASASSEELVAAGKDEFRFKGIDATLSFSRSIGGQVTGLHMRQNGADTPAPRLDAAQVNAVRRTIESHIQSHQPAAGSEKALRGLIDGLSSGAPDFSIMSAQMAGGTRVMLPEFHKALEKLGGVRALDFRGVNGDGWDQYVVQHDRGQSSWQIAVDRRGTIVGAVWHEGS